MGSARISAGTLGGLAVKPDLQHVEPFELEAFWWRPGAPKTEAPHHGTVRFDPEGGLWLTVFGWYNDYQPATPLQVPFVHGVSFGGKPITLLELVASQHTGQLFGGYSRDELRASWLLEGVHVDSSEALVLERARVRYRGLSEWLAEPAVTENGRDLLESVEVNAAGARISFGFDRVDQKPSRFESRQKRLGTALFEFPSPVSLKDCVQDWVGAVQDLLVFATREQSLVEAVTVSFWDPSIAEKIAPAIRAGAPNRDWNRVDVRIAYRHGVRLAPKRHPYERILFGPAALGESASDVLGRFFDLHRQLRPVATVLFNELNLAVPSLEKRVITLMAFAEAYHRELHDDRPLSRADHRRFRKEMLGAIDDEHARAVYAARLDYANEQSAKERLDELFDRASTVLAELDKSAGSLPRQLVATRNRYVHWGEPSEHVLDFQPLIDALRTLIVVVQVNLLLDLEVEAKLIERLIQKSYLGQNVL